MTYNRLPINTPAVLRKHGLKVFETAGWFSRGRPTSTGNFDPVGVLCHHTATGKNATDSSVVNLLIKGRSDLAGPLCHFGLGRDGTVYMIASGRANHAGKAKAHGSVAAGDGNALYIGIEAFNDGVGEPWTDVQYNAYVLLAAVISLEFTGNSVNTVSGHKETSVTGKVDPRFDMDTFRKHVKAKMVELQTPAAPPVKPAKPKPTGSKTVATLAKEVLAGKWGNGPARVKKLTAEGYDAKAVQAAVDKLQAAKKPSTPKENKSFLFRVHLVPGNKSETVAEIKSDMEIVKAKTAGNSALVINTERESAAQRNAVADGLGKGWTAEFSNENVMAYGSDWELDGVPTVEVLAKDDPYLSGVSPTRRLNTLPLRNQSLPTVTIRHKGTHLVSEPWCVHMDIKGKEWRQKTWHLQVDDLIKSIKDDLSFGDPVVLSGDLNTGVKFTGGQLFSLFKEHFGDSVVHVHNGNLDHIFAFSTDKVKISKVDVADLSTDNKSDHNMVTANLRVELL